MYKPEPPAFSKHKVKCEKDGCPLTAEYEAITAAREKHYCCEAHLEHLLSQVQVVSWKKM